MCGIVLLLSSSMTMLKAEVEDADCTLICIGHVNLSLESSCTTTVTYQSILQNYNSYTQCIRLGFHSYRVTLFDAAGNDLGSTITEEHIGQTLDVHVRNTYTNNFCWGTITVEDKVGPWTACLDDVTVGCSESTDPSNTGTPVWTDCSDFTLDYFDEVEDQPCTGSIVSTIKRTWVATDVFNNSKRCFQYIHIERSTLDDVEAPVNFDSSGGADHPALTCGASIAPKDLPGSRAFPTINGLPIDSENALCRIGATFEDSAPIPICGNGFKVLREWTVIDWCDGEKRVYNQIITVGDEVAPSITCQPTLYVGTDAHKCAATVHIPHATVSDNCSSVSVRVNTPFGQLTSNGGTLSDVPVGSYTITYVATDECGNQATCETQIVVQDDDPPIAVCDQSTIVSLSSDDITKVQARAFDSGSFDNCANVDFLATRDGQFRDYVPFSCSDVDAGVIMVRLRVFEVGRPDTYAECVVEVTVQDEKPPVLLSCPTDVTVDCDDLSIDLSVYGAPTFGDNCGFTVEPSVTRDLDNCGVGKIIRTWTAQDDNGSVSCRQTITVLNLTPFDGNIQFPPDVTLNECGAEITEDLIGAPVIPNIDCGLLSVNFVDESFNTNTDACLKVVRRWKVIDWCQYNPALDPNKGLWEHFQTIEVVDKVDPVLSVPSDILFKSTENNCQSAQVTIPIATATDCNPNVIISNNSPYASNSGANASGRYPFGTTVVTFTANDGCGNFVTQTMTVTVMDGKKPSPVCLSGIVVEMGQHGSVDLWAIDLEASSSDNCTPYEDLQFRIRRGSGENNTTPPSTDVISLGCDVFTNGDTPNAAAVPVEVWVGDQSGNWDFCVTFIAVQDNMDACDDPSGLGDVGAMIAGKIETTDGSKVNNVNLNLTSSDPVYNQFLAGINGSFLFNNLLSGVNYTISPSKENAYSNGITTLDILKIYRHILGTEHFSSPYEIIAADVNGSGNVSTADILALRRMILGLKDDFGDNGQSWTFVKSDYQFTNPTDPLSENYETDATYSGLTTQIYDADFIGIKMGDINNTANTGLDGQASWDRQSTLTIQDVEMDAGEVYEIPISLSDDGMISGMQFQLGYDADDLEILDVQSTSVTFGESHYTIDDSGLKMSWTQNDATTIDNFITIAVRAKKTINLAQSIYIKEDISPEMYDEDLNVIGLDLQFIDALTVANDVKIYPNPFSETATLTLDIAKAGTAAISIIDLSGQEIHSVQKDLAEGQHQIDLDRSMFRGAGVYFVKVGLETEQITKKLVLAY